MYSVLIRVLLAAVLIGQGAFAPAIALRMADHAGGKPPCAMHEPASGQHECPCCPAGHDADDCLMQCATAPALPVTMAVVKFSGDPVETFLHRAQLRADCARAPPTPPPIA